MFFGLVWQHAPLSCCIITWTVFLTISSVNSLDGQAIPLLVPLLLVLLLLVLSQLLLVGGELEQLQEGNAQKVGEEVEQGRKEEKENGGESG